LQKPRIKIPGNPTGIQSQDPQVRPFHPIDAKGLTLPYDLIGILPHGPVDDSPFIFAGAHRDVFLLIEPDVFASKMRG
jgi:hypothetical protein